MKVEGICATTGKDLVNEQFAPEVFETFIRESVGRPIEYNFDGVEHGKVEWVHKDEKGVTIGATITDPKIINLVKKGCKTYCVPSFTAIASHDEEDVRVFDKIANIGFSLTVMPADPSIAPLREKDE